MTVPIITFEQRLNERRGARVLIVGPFGIGKTSLVRHLDPATTHFMDIENGALAIEDVPVPHMRPQTWPEIRDLIVRIAGPNRSFQPHEPYSQAHFDMCGGYLPEIERLQTVVLDTVTAGTRLCFRWATAQPENFSERTGRSDQRAAYGHYAREFLLALHHLQSARKLNVVLIGALESVTDEYGRLEHRLQAEGQRVPREIAGIVDWSRPVGSWSKNTVIRFLLTAMNLIAAAMAARDVSGGGIATNRKSVEEMQRVASAEAGGPLAVPGELDDGLLGL